MSAACLASRTGPEADLITGHIAKRFSDVVLGKRVAHFHR
jgi:hypothetical protein